jgi:hypothetical protein
MVGFIDVKRLCLVTVLFSVSEMNLLYREFKDSFPKDCADG